MIVDHVADIEHAKKLKEKGFPQETEFYHVFDENGFSVRHKTWQMISRCAPVSAPMATELLASLPQEVVTGRDEHGYWAAYDESRRKESVQTEASSLPNALADLYCELHK